MATITHIDCRGREIPSEDLLIEKPKEAPLPHAKIENNPILININKKDIIEDQEDIESTELVKSAELVKSVESAELIKSIQSIESAKTVESVKSAESLEPSTNEIKIDVPITIPINTYSKEDLIIDLEYKKISKLTSKKVCLNMIVKNEAHIIRETLECVLPYIDSFVISDTGSTDGTQGIIIDFFRKHQIPGKVVEHKWKHFGHNRSLALQACKDSDVVKHIDYIWIIDADDVIKGQLIFPEKMTADSYEIRIGTDFMYHRQQIFSNKLDWIYVGVRHEYPQCTNKRNTVIEMLAGAYLDSRRLGDRSKDPKKYLNDAMSFWLKGMKRKYRKKTNFWRHVIPFMLLKVILIMVNVKRVFLGIENVSKWVVLLEKFIILITKLGGHYSF